MPLASYDGAQMHVDEAGGITVPGLSVAQFGPDQFLTFGDPETNYGQVGYTTMYPVGFGVGRGTGTNAVGFFLSNDDTIYLVNRWDPFMLGAKLGIVMSTAYGARYIEINAKDAGPGQRARITLRGDTGNESLNLYCVGKSSLGSDCYGLLIDPLGGTVDIYAAESGPDITLDANTGTISLSGTVIQAGAGANQVVLNDATDTITLQTYNINRVVLDDPTDTIILQTSSGIPTITLDGSTGTINLYGDIIMAPNERLNCTGAILRIPQAAPTSPRAGDMYVNTTTNTLYIYNGTDWKSVALT